MFYYKKIENEEVIEIGSHSLIVPPGSIEIKCIMVDFLFTLEKLQGVSDCRKQEMQKMCRPLVGCNH